MYGALLACAASGARWWHWCMPAAWHCSECLPSVHIALIANCCSSQLRRAINNVLLMIPNLLTEDQLRDLNSYVDRDIQTPLIQSVNATMNG
jgi:hypothetical protein